MAEVFGAVAAGVALCTELTKLGRAIHKATKRIKNAGRDIAELTDETVIFAGLCEDFLRTCADDHDAESSAVSSILPLNSWIKRTSTGLCDLLRKVEAVGPEPMHQYSIQNTLIAHIEWFFSKETVRRLRDSLTVARASMSGFSNLMCIRKLNEELHMLGAALSNRTSRKDIELRFGMSVEEKIRMVKQAIEIKGSVHHTNRRILKAAKQEIVSKQQGTHSPDLDNTLVDLFDFTESFGAYEREVMPSVRSERRRSSKYASTSTSRSTLELAPPKRQRSDNHRSMPTPSQPKDIRNSEPIPSPPATSNVSTGSHSGNRLDSRTQADARSGKLSPSRPASRDTVNKSNSRKLKHFTTGFTEHRDMKTREYMNAPNGNILSNPKVKSRTQSTPTRKTSQIGHHTIVLDATHIHIDNHRLRFEMYATANEFFRVLHRHADKIDALIEALAMENEEETWEGIPGWVVDAHGVTMQASALAVDDENREEDA